MSSIGFGSKSVASEASAALKQVSRGSKPLRYGGREKFAEHIQDLFRVFGKASPFANGTAKSLVRAPAR